MHKCRVVQTFCVFDCTFCAVKDVNATSGVTYPLIDSAKTGDSLRLKVLTEEKWLHNADATDASKMTALMHCARLGHTEMLQCLLKEWKPNIHREE